MKIFCKQAFFPNFVQQKNFRQFKADIKKNYELNNVFMPNTFIVIRLDGNNFKYLTQFYGLHKPNDQSHINLMNRCALSVFKTFKTDIQSVYGYSDEVNFVFEETTSLFNRELK
jgi:tRNA(His) guanylyltransferase